MFKKNFFKMIISISILAFSSSLVGCSKSLPKDNKESKYSSNLNIEKNESNTIKYSNKDEIQEEKSKITKENKKDFNLKWGLGKTENESISNDKNYSWYIEQNTTGEFGNINCVPASVVMALKWINKDFSKSTEDLKKEYIKRFYLYEGWNSQYALRALRENGAKAYIENKNISKENLKNHIKNGSIVIASVDMQYISKNSNKEERIGRIYGSGKSYHALIIKGYKVVDGNLYFESYDPDSNKERYSDGSYKGKDRYYLGDELINSILKRNGDFIIINGDTYKEVPIEGSKGNLVSFKDSNIEKAVRKELGIINGPSYKDPIFQKDLNLVFNLSLSNLNLSSTEDLKSMKNLDSLDLSNCNLSNIDFLNDLKNLTKLNLSNNKIKDITSLKNLNSLKELNISNNHIENINSLKKLNNLKKLYISNNPLKVSYKLPYYNNLNSKDF